MSESQDPESQPKGFFITLEGPEGSGKSTQAVMLKDFLEASGRKVLKTREPGGTGFGDKIRTLLLDHSKVSLQPGTEVLLMLAQRNEHLAQVIRPALDEGQIVICDRYFDSSMAYQGAGRGLDPEFIRRLHQDFLGKFLPDTTILLDIEPEKGLLRAGRSRNEFLDRMESETLCFHRRVRGGYLRLAAEEPQRFKVLNAELAPDILHEQIVSFLKNSAIM